MEPPPTPVSGSVVVKVLGEWKCLVCEVSASSAEQMDAHVSGERHAYSLATIKARSPEYLNHCVISSLKSLMPDYPAVFPAQSKVREALRHKTPLIECTPTIRTEEAVDSSVIYGQSLTSVETSTSFFDTFYRNVLPVGVFHCEPCLRSMASVTAYLSHFSSREHQMTLESFERNETDYFQPVLDGDRVFFVGVLTRTVIVAADFFSRKRGILALQWRVANRTPTEQSAIMQVSSRQFMSYFAPPSVSQRLIRCD